MQFEGRPPVVVILWFSMMASVGILALVAWFVDQGRTGPPPGPAIVAPILGGVGILCGVASFFLYRLVVSDPAQRGELDLTTAEGLQRYTQAHCLVWTLCEAVACFGLAVFIVTGNDLWGSGLFALALVLLWLHGPRHHQPGNGVDLARPEIKLG